ncbi:hypothetical protein E1180_16465 [Roseibium denhamense]|uniref:Sel1 repeat family protein n=1 Tax=Roseibium denhamense TaxID=76305 RepID=A0ABY1P620_9HYPH|nr:hypothetical protein [Roseibium denhamense]MTI07104.1 hypothetical protein [Roseibium denhamense]SMP27110.1 hypothetical protein SAMN06265374_2856 [Roseibium denhamense]
MSISTRFVQVFAALLAGCLALAPQTRAADLLSKQWQEQREAMNALGDAACKGDQQAYQRLQSLQEHQDPVAITELSWLTWEADCKPHPFKVPNSRLFEYETLRDLAYRTTYYGYMTAAYLGYPVAQAILAETNMNHISEAPDFRKETLCLFHLAMTGGFETAGATLGERYLTGRGLFRSRARAKALYNVALGDAVQDSAMDTLKAAFPDVRHNRALAKAYLDKELAKCPERLKVKEGRITAFDPENTLQ